MLILSPIASAQDEVFPVDLNKLQACYLMGKVIESNFIYHFLVSSQTLTIQMFNHIINTQFKADRL